MSHFSGEDLHSTCLTNPPQHWWRLLGPHDWTDFSIWGLYDRVLDTLEFLNEPRWTEARQGDAAAAIALALKYDRPDVHLALVDAIMSTLVVASLAGNRAARLVLIKALARRRRVDPAFDHALEAWSELDHELVMEQRIARSARRKRGTDDAELAPRDDAML